MRNQPLRQPEDTNPLIEEFISTNRPEAVRRYNLLLAEINQAKGQGIASIHNRHFSSKGIYFGSAIQYLYRTNGGQPLPEEKSTETTPAETTTESLESPKSATQPKSIEEISHPTHNSALQATHPKPHPSEGANDDDDDNDASNFIARHAS